MLKRAILSSSLALMLSASPVLAAQDNTEDFDFPTEEEEAMEAFEQEVTDAFAMFSELFKAEPLTAEQEALLPLANEMAIAVMPEGSFRLVMKDSVEPLFQSMMSAFADDPRFRLAQITGVEATDLDQINDETAQEALDVFDPEYAARNERMGVLIVDMLTEMFDAMEPAYRDAYASALTTRFDEAEMRALLAFFDTPVGAKFATASFNIQYDPQMLGIMEQMGPAMVEVMPRMMTSFENLEAEFVQERRFSELSTAERERVAQLLDKPVTELEALEPEPENEEAQAEDALYEEA